MNGYKVVVDKSTVPVGTAAEGARRHPPRDHAPVQRRQQPRVPEGGRGDRRLHEARPRRHRRRGSAGAPSCMGELYEPFVRTGAPIIVMDCASAELTKYAANAMLATRISFMNEIANVCERVGADVDRRAPGDRLATGASAPRSCSPASATAAAASRRTSRRSSSSRPTRSTTSRSSKAVEAVNERRSALLVRQDGARTSARSRARPIAVWGLAFKPQTDDMREAPADADHRGAARARAPRCRPTTPRRWNVAKGIFGDRDHLRDRRPTTRSKGADALRGRHRVEGVPRARLRSACAS